MRLYTAKTVLQITGCKAFELADWTRKDRGYFTPASPAKGSGTRNRFDVDDMVIVTVLRALKNAGCIELGVSFVNESYPHRGMGSLGSWAFANSYGEVFKPIKKERICSFRKFGSYEVIIDVKVMTSVIRREIHKKLDKTTNR